ncbi:hypothetical protein HK104_002408 [Borealophlyctis nickersoniae]|nr:hypothetical protein HK104_002408 [Borealophlyctis nickersoniae]
MADSTPDLSKSTLFDVSGKVALVTGGGTGIGKMIAASLVQNGALVYIASRKLSTVTPTAQELTARGPGKCLALQADLQTKADCYALADQIKAREKKLDILVNNAGMSWGFKLEDAPEKDAWDRLMALNVKSPFYLTVALLPLLENGADNINPGRVINISSIAGTSSVAENSLSAPGTGTWSYAVSKAAVNHLTRVMASTLARRKVTVNVIAPGVFPSRMTRFGIEHAKEDLESVQPLGRVGTSEDMAGLALFLCSRASAHITGAVIPIDGGASLGTSGMAKL